MVEGAAARTVDRRCVISCDVGNQAAGGALEVGHPSSRSGRAVAAGADIAAVEEGAVVVERFAVKMHDSVPVLERLAAGRAAARIEALCLGQ
jgi:hypothetical protein